MKRIALTLLLVLGFSISSGLSQTIQAPGGVNFGNGTVIRETSGNGVPTSSCTGLVRYTQLDAADGSNLWQCINGVMVQQVGTGSGGGSACDPTSPTGQCTINKQLNVPNVQAGAAITGHKATLTNLSAIPADWTEDFTTPTTAIQSMLPGVSPDGNSGINVVGGATVGTTKIGPDEGVNIKAFSGATCNNIADDTAAFQAAVTALGPNGGVIKIPNNCYFANPTSITYPSYASHTLTVEIYGSLRTGSTFNPPSFVSIVGKGSGAGSQFANAPIGVISGPTNGGTVGTSITAGTATFTPSSMTGIYPGTGLHVTGYVTCTVSGAITRVGNLVTATTASPCHIAPGYQVNITGVADSSFNVASVTIASNDYNTNVITWKQTAADASSTGGTWTGVNEDSIETVLVTATTSTTATALFVANHASSDVFGINTIDLTGVSGNRLEHLQVSGSGTHIWVYTGVADTLDSISSQATAETQEVLELNMASYGHYRHLALLHWFSGSWTIRMTNQNRITTSGTGINTIDDSFISGGIKLDRGQTCCVGMGQLYLHNNLFEQVTRGAVTADLTSSVMDDVRMSDTFLQDNFNGYTQCSIHYIYPAATGVFYLDGPVTNSNGSAICNANTYFQGILNTGGTSQGGILPGGSAPTSVHIQSAALEAELVGGGANFSPSIIPYPSLNVPTSPASWTGGTCTVTTGVQAPDGTTNAGSLLGASTNSFTTILSYSVTPQAGDSIIWGGWILGGPNDSGGGNFGTVFLGGLLGDTKIAQFDNQTRGNWWHPVVGAYKFPATLSAGTVALALGCKPTVPTGYFMPFMIYVPASANVSDLEIRRWRQQLLHGMVPPSASASTEYANHPLDLQTNPLVEDLPNNTASGATLNKLTCSANVSGVYKAQTCTTASTMWSGVAIGGATGSTAGNTQIARSMQASCIFDGSTTVGDYVQISSTVAGDCHDTGSTTYPTTGAVIGKVVTANGGAGVVAKVNLYSPGITAAAGGGSSAPQSVTLALGAAAGTGATIACVSGFVCDSQSGIVQIASGTSAGFGNAFSITWSTALSKAAVSVANSYVVNGANGAAFSQNATPSTTSVTFLTHTWASSTTYFVAYHIDPAS